jgi:hypothetical protein
MKVSCNGDRAAGIRNNLYHSAIGTAAFRSANIKNSLSLPRNYHSVSILRLQPHKLSYSRITIPRICFSRDLGGASVQILGSKHVHLNFLLYQDTHSISDSFSSSLLNCYFKFEIPSLRCGRGTLSTLQSCPSNPPKHNSATSPSQILISSS